jgi:hypothetical protein
MYYSIVMRLAVDVRNQQASHLAWLCDELRGLVRFAGGKPVL